jgi:sugar fermentation stimulation protein A
LNADFGPLIEGRFVRRDNRFRVQVQLEQQIVAAHLPNSGRLGELLVAGRTVWLAPADIARNPNRRTAYDLTLVEYQGRLVSVDARLPGHLIAAALQRRQLDSFGHYTKFQREVRLGHSRIDFQLTGSVEPETCWLEVKSVTLVDPETNTALFPDAPTVRGQRHLNELIQAVEAGDRASVVFVIQRDDARRFTPYDQADPAFGETLRRAAQGGVAVHAWRCHVSKRAMQLLERIPVQL